MGGGAQGRAEHPVLDSDYGRVSSICPASEREELPPRSNTFRPWADVQADAGNAAVCAVAAGLLAAGTGWIRANLAKRSASVVIGKNPIDGIIRRFVRRYTLRPS